jgi:CubicO group peptidase (beta-lactamase class C family)
MKIHCSLLGPDFENIVIEAIHNHEPCSDTGVAVAVINDGRLDFAGGFGFRDRAAVTPVDVETRFAIGSATKAFTSMAASILVAEQQTFTLTTPIKQLMPDFDMMDPVAANETTLEDILSHQTGLAPHNCLWYLGPFTRSEIFYRLRYLQPAEAFRAGFVYNNIMYMVAGYLLERLTGTSYEDIIQTRILDPLGMSRTDLSFAEFTARPNHAKGYEDFAQLQLKDFTNIGPAAEINSCVLDMAKWVQLFLRNGVGANGATLLDQTAMELMYKPFSDPGDGTKYGLGWNIGSIQPLNSSDAKRLIFHTGDPDGQSTYVSFMPDDGLAVVVLTNQQCTNALINNWPDKVATDIYDYLLNGQATGQLSLPKPKAPTGLGMDRRPVPVVVAPKGAAAPAAPDTLDSFTGMFSNRGYGELVVSRCGDGLNISYYGSSWPLQPVSDKLFAFRVPAFGTIFPVRVVFAEDSAGAIKSLAATLVLQPTVIDIIFDKH